MARAIGKDPISMELLVTRMVRDTALNHRERVAGVVPF